jgi:hypothetical protein
MSDHCVAFGQKLWRKVAALGPTLMTRMFGGRIFLIEQDFSVTQSVKHTPILK